MSNLTPSPNNVSGGSGSGGGSLPASIDTNQVIVAVTGTAVQFPSNALVNGVIITAHGANAASVVLGGATITNTLTGSGNGAELIAGSSVFTAVSNTNVLYLNGTAGDWVSFIGN